MMMEDGPGLPTVAAGDLNKFVSHIYCMSHAGIGHCGNPHDDWLDLIDEAQKYLEEANYIEMDRATEQVMKGEKPNYGTIVQFMKGEKPDCKSPQ